MIVAQGGQVEGEIKAETITIAGKVKGDVFASQKIELTPTAEVEGDITSPRILIREGATFEGQVVHDRQERRREPATRQARRRMIRRKARRNRIEGGPG